MVLVQRRGCRVQVRVQERIAGRHVAADAVIERVLR